MKATKQQAVLNKVAGIVRKCDRLQERYARMRGESVSAMSAAMRKKFRFDVPHARGWPAGVPLPLVNKHVEEVLNDVQVDTETDDTPLVNIWRTKDRRDYFVWWQDGSVTMFFPLPARLAKLSAVDMLLRCLPGDLADEFFGSIVEAVK
jgi:hypothetical protein